MNTLGSRIKKARGKVSQEAFAREIEVSKGSLGFYERDENLPNTNVVLKICSVTGVLLEWLLMGSGPMYSEGGLAAPMNRGPSGAPERAPCAVPHAEPSGTRLDISCAELNYQQGATPLLQPVNTSEKVNTMWALRCEMLEKKLDKVESQRDDLALENRELWRRIDFMKSENFELRLALERKGGIDQKDKRPEESRLHSIQACSFAKDFPVE